MIAARLAARGRHSRFERQPGSSETESSLYQDTSARLADVGWPVCTIDVTTLAVRMWAFCALMTWWAGSLVFFLRPA